MKSEELNREALAALLEWYVESGVDLALDEDRLWAEGGWGAGLARAGALCCIGEAVK